jgi:DNA-binding response OmpR family regulator
MSVTDTNKGKVLLVDDEQDITAVMKKGLEINGFDVNAYTNPQTAFAEYGNNHYDIHIIDLRMPGMNGFELARRIWQINPQAKVCFFTAFEIYESEAKKVFPNLKAHCFLKKPMSPLALAEHIKTHMIDA